MTARLPNVGGDDGNWGYILNDYLSQSLNSDGSIRASAIINKEDVSNKSTDVSTDGSSDEKYPSVKSVKSYIDPKINTLNAHNIKSYGAVGDGTTDDTTAIQAAIDALPASDGVLFIPQGTYIVSGLKMTKKSTAYVYGEGNGSVLSLKDNSNKDLLYCTWCDRTIFNHFRLEGNKGHNTSGNCIVLTDNSAYACVEAMEIHNAAECGVFIRGGYDPDNLTNYLYTDEVHVNQSFIRWNGQSGIRMEGVGGCIITNSELEYNVDHGLCTTFNGISGANGHIISGCNILSNEKCGIRLFTSSRVTIIGNVFVFNHDNGIYTEGDGWNWVIGNQFEDNGQTTHAGQIKTAYQTDIWIMNNIFTNVDTVHPGSYYGVECYSAGTARFLGNSFTNHPSGSIYMNDTKHFALFNEGLDDYISSVSATIFSGAVSSNAISVNIDGYVSGKIYYVSINGAITASCTVAINGGTAYNLIDKTGANVTTLAQNSVIAIYQPTGTSSFQLI